MGYRLLAAVAGLVLLLCASAYAVVAASLPRRGGEAPLPTTGSRKSMRILRVAE